MKNKKRVIFPQLKLYEKPNELDRLVRNLINFER